MLNKRAAGQSPSDLLTLHVQPVTFKAFLVFFLFYFLCKSFCTALRSIFATVSVESALSAFSMMTVEFLSETAVLELLLFDSF